MAVDKAGRLVHEIRCSSAKLRLLGLLERKLKSSESYQQDAEAVYEESEKDEPERAIILLCVGLVQEVDLIKVGNALREAMQLHLGSKQDHDQTAAETYVRKEERSARKAILTQVTAVQWRFLPLTEPSRQRCQQGTTLFHSNPTLVFLLSMVPFFRQHCIEGTVEGKKDQWQ